MSKATDTSPSVTEGRPNGDAGDAIDFALGHLDKSNVVAFLEDWREDRALEWSGYERWLEVQREGARKARLTLPVDETSASPTPRGTGD